MEANGDAVIVMRCKSCGDTFPAHDRNDIRCPSCAGELIEPASEPLL